MCVKLGIITIPGPTHSRLNIFLSRPNHVIRSDFVSHPAGFPKKCQPLIQREHISSFKLVSSLSLSAARARPSCACGEATPRPAHVTQRGAGLKPPPSRRSPESHNYEKSTFRWSCSSGRTRLSPPPPGFPSAAHRAARRR